MGGFLVLLAFGRQPLLRLLNHYALIATVTIKTPSLLLRNLATMLSVILGLSGEPGNTEVHNHP